MPVLLDLLAKYRETLDANNDANFAKIKQDFLNTSIQNEQFLLQDVHDFFKATQTPDEDSLFLEYFTTHVLPHPQINQFLIRCLESVKTAPTPRNVMWQMFNTIPSEQLLATFESASPESQSLLIEYMPTSVKTTLLIKEIEQQDLTQEKLNFYGNGVNWMELVKHCDHHNLQDALKLILKQPYIYAWTQYDEDAFKILMKNNVPIPHEPHERFSPLQTYILNGRDSRIEMMLASDIDLKLDYVVPPNPYNPMDYIHNGHTALSLALLQKKWDIAEKLYAKGARINFDNYINLTYNLGTDEERNRAVKYLSPQARIRLDWEKIDSLYNFNLLTISNRLFVNNAYNKSIENYDHPTFYTGPIISNNQGYIPGNNSGQRICVENTNVPIGYNIHLPQNDTPIQNILIKVYGGSPTITYSPGNLNSLESHLLQQGTLFITLNLPDILNMSPFSVQGAMSEALFDEIQKAIHSFYTILTTEPEKIHAQLASLDLAKKPIFLTGASFGGLMTVRHAQRYPGTFSGYISVEGAISTKMLTKSDLLGGRKFEAWLNPANPVEIDKITEPLLLIQNRDDNNVNAKTTFDFYKTLVRANKGGLARVCITQVSNAAESLEVKGHSLPPNKEALMRVFNVVSTFMSRGPASLPEVTRWQAYNQDLLANKGYKAATLPEKFVAEVLERAQFDENLRKNLRNPEMIWEKHLRPLFYAMDFVEILAHDETGASTKEFNRLALLGLPSDGMLLKAFKAQSSAIAQFMEATGESFKEQSEREGFDEAMIVIFKNKLKDIQANPNNYAPSVRHFMLNALYLQNPELLEPLYPQFEQDQSLQASLESAKQELRTALKERRKLIIDLWKGAAREGTKKKSEIKRDESTSVQKPSKS